MDTQTSLYLDTRRAKLDNTYPVKIRLWHNGFKKAKLYPTKFTLTKQEFERVWETERPRNENKALRSELNQVLAHAEKIAVDLDPFSFDAFEKLLYRKAGVGKNVFWHFDQLIEYFNKHEQFGTASNYDLSKKSLVKFVNYKAGIGDVDFDNPCALYFSEIDVEFLEDYEQWMQRTPISKNKRQGRSITTISIYMRALRAVFNKAISSKDIPEEIYPFGNSKYIIPATANIKKALDIDQLITLYHSIPKTIEQEKAKDFFFLSYLASGMNIKDIAMLRFKNIEVNRFTFLRAKTITTKKKKLVPVVVTLNDGIRAIFEKYGSTETDPDNFVFPILSNGMSTKEQFIKVKNFTKFVNQHIKKLAEDNGLPGDISTYYARHSFATNAIRDGASIELLRESLGHNSSKTTQAYLAGFDDAAKIKMSINTYQALQPRKSDEVN